LLTPTFHLSLSPSLSLSLTAAAITVYVSGGDAAAGGTGGPIITEPAKHPVTLRHLLTHSSGLDYGLWTNSPISVQYRVAGAELPIKLTKHTDAKLPPPASLGEWVARVSKIPLLFQPGERFRYGARFRT
jgi:CubicO group peptidase (beta-lactamase class C family)